MKPTSRTGVSCPWKARTLTCAGRPFFGERNSAAHPDTAAGLDHNYVLDSEPGDKIAAILLDPLQATA